MTGGGKGIGKEIALELASKDYDILVVVRTETDLKQVYSEIEQSFAPKTQYFVIDLS